MSADTHTCRYADEAHYLTHERDEAVATVKSQRIRIEELEARLFSEVQAHQETAMRSAALEEALRDVLALPFAWGDHPEIVERARAVRDPRCVEFGTVGCVQSGAGHLCGPAFTAKAGQE